MFYTYIWKDASGVPFYVGIGGNDDYRRSRDVSNRSAWFRAEHTKGGCTVEIADEFTLRSEAAAHEVELIERFGRRDIGTGILANRTDGGEGMSGPSDEARERMSAAKRGKKLSPETRARIGESQIGKKLSPGHVAKLSAAQRKRYEDPLERAKIGAAQIGKKMSPEAVAKSAATRSMGPPHADNKSGFKGVTFHKRDNRWLARITLDGKRRELGAFSSAIDAARAYDASAIASGNGGYLNFPPIAANDNTPSATLMRTG